MKPVPQYQLHTFLSIALAIAISANAHAEAGFGFGFGRPRDSVFDSGMLSVYTDYIHSSEAPLTWRAGVDWSYATRAFDGYAPDVTYTGWGGRAAGVWYFRTPGHGFYLGGGPSFLHYTL